MLKHLLLMMIFFLSLLHSEPSMAQMKQAVSQNPALLNTPQAKAMMQKKSVSLNEVKQKLSESKKTETTEIQDTTLENDITVENDKDDKDNITTNLKKSSLAKRINPFLYKSDKMIRKELNAKQQIRKSKKLSRYSMNFYSNKNKINSSSLPTPDNYIVSTGDSLNIHIYGDRDKNIGLKVKNDGTVELAFIGPVHIGGMEFKDAKAHLKSKLRAHYQMSSFNVKINKYSTIQVTLIGDIKYPGLYNLSSFSTVKDLLINAKGIKNSSSVREIIIKRDSIIIAILDFYELLFKGNKFSTQLLKQGDVVIIKKAKKLVSIDGYVNNSAIFELTDSENLNQLIQYAGGIKPNASKLNIKIDRYLDNSKFETFKISFKDAKNFKMLNGDKVYIYPLDFTAKNSVNIYGNIIRPGSYNLSNHKTLFWLFKKTIKGGLKSFFLPNTHFEYGILKRYKTDLTYTTLSFNLTDVLKGTQTIRLKPNDQIFIFSQNDIFSNSYIITKGKSLVDAGKLQYVNGITIRDAINASGIDGVLDDKVRVTTYKTDNFMPKTSFYSLKTEGNTKLNPYDEIEVYDYYSKHILEPVSISGEVVKQTSIYYEEGMTAQKLLNLAGGFNKQAYTKSLTIIRYYVDKTQTRQQKVLNYNLEKTPLENIKLEPYDQVKISKILGWNAQDYDVVSISGEVHNPIKVKYGTGMSIADLVVMAGGLTKRAYTNNLELVRYFLDENLTRQRKITKIDTKEKNLSEIKLEAYDEVKIFKIPHWGEKSNITLKGEVQFPGNYSIEKGEKLSSVIQRAGGYTDTAFIEGAVFTRESIRRNQIEQYNRSLAKIKRTLAIYNAMPANSKNATSTSATTGTLTEVINEAKKYQPIGRVSIQLDANLTQFQESEYDLVLKNGDSIAIPTKIDTITVFGEVFNPTSFVYNSNLDADEYIELASGYSRAADTDNIYVIHANGTSEPIDNGWCSFDAEISKGDTIVVPMYIREQNSIELWDSIAKLLASFALTAAAVNSLGII